MKTLRILVGVISVGLLASGFVSGGPAFYGSDLGFWFGHEQQSVRFVTFHEIASKYIIPIDL
jgi:hypothetical protein